MGSIPRFLAHPIGSLLSGPVEPRGAYTNSPWLQNPLRFRQNPPRNMPERSFFQYNSIQFLCGGYAEGTQG